MSGSSEFLTSWVEDNSFKLMSNDIDSENSWSEDYDKTVHLVHSLSKFPFCNSVKF